MIKGIFSNIFGKKNTGETKPAASGQPPAAPVRPPVNPRTEFYRRVNAMHRSPEEEAMAGLLAIPCDHRNNGKVVDKKECQRCHGTGRVGLESVRMQNGEILTPEKMWWTVPPDGV
jgi:hypothetical protein